MSFLKTLTIYPGKYKILPEVMEFCLSSEFFSQMETLLADHEKDFAGGAKEQEHQLKYTAIHKKFVGVFEQKLEKFITDKGVKLEEFMTLCQTATDLNDPNMKAFLDVLLNSLDYLTFVDMARDVNKRKYFYNIMSMYKKHIAAMTQKK